MAVISDDKFLRPPEEAAPAAFDKANLTGIASKDKWAAMRKVSEMVPTPKVAADDAFPQGTLVEFVAPDGTEYKGKVASKSGADYLVEISQGESYIVPTGRLAKVTPESERIKEAMHRYVAPSIKMVGKPTIEVQNRCCARIAYKERRPTDDDLIKWASDQYPDWRLVDAIDGDDREIGLIFEILAAADIGSQQEEFLKYVPVPSWKLHGSSDPLNVAVADMTVEDMSRDETGRRFISEIMIHHHEGTQLEILQDILSKNGSKVAAADPKPQGGDQVTRGQPLSSELVEGTGVIAEDDHEDQLPGGLADDSEPEEFCPYALADGIEVEMEHTDDESVAREIAMDHLTEDPEYYKKLKTIEASTISLDSISKTSNIVSYAEVIPAKNAQLGEPGDGEDYKDLVRAARWVLARFNDSNPDYYAIPQESEEAGDGDDRIVRLSFLLEKKTDDNQLDHLYISRGGKIIEGTKEPGMKPARGYVQVDSEGNLPMVMLNTPMGPESIQEYEGFNFFAEREIAKLADYDMCAAAADDVLGEFGGYSADAQAAFEARLVKLAVDDSAKDYWRGYFGQYGKMMTRDIGKKKKTPKKTAHRKTAIDDNAKQYWINYFGVGGNAWYGEAMTRDIPRRPIGDDSSPQTAPKKEKPSKKEAQSNDDIPDSEWPEVEVPYDVDEDPRIVEKPKDLHEPASPEHHHVQTVHPFREAGIVYFKDGTKVYKGVGDAKWIFYTPDGKFETDNSGMHLPEKYDPYVAAMWDPGNSIDFRDMTRDETVAFETYYKNDGRPLTSKWMEKIDDHFQEYTASKTAVSDYEGYIKEEDGKYKVKSKNNPDWSGGSYDSKGEAEKRLQQVEMFKHMSKKACEDDGGEVDPAFINRMAIVGVVLDDLIHKSADDIEAVFGKPQFTRRKQPTPSGTPLRDIYDIATWSLEIAGKDEKMYHAVYALVYDFLRKNPTFLQNQLGTDNLDQHGVGYTLAYALATSPRTFNKFKKSVNKYQRRWEKGQWQDLQKSTDSWRKDQKGSPKNKGEGDTDIGDQMGEELEVELEEADVEVVEDAPEAKPAKDAPPAPTEEAPAEAAPPAEKKAPAKAPAKKPAPKDEDWLNPGQSSTIPDGQQYKMEYTSMKRRSDAAPGPVTHNAPGKDDKKDYDHKNPRVQPSKAGTKFEVTRMYSTTSSADNGYILMELAWEPKDFESMSGQNIQQQLISHIKGMESNKEFHDFGIMGRVRIMDFDEDAGVARIKVRSSETRGVPTLGYAGDIDEPIPTSGIR